MIEMPRSWWHGCWLQPGHYLFGRGGRRIWDGECPVGPEPYWLDGQLAPRRAQARAWLPFERPSDGIVFERMGADDRDLRHRIKLASEECPQGDFLLHSIAGCTIAAWWDRTQSDTRPACNSCLIVENIGGGVDWTASAMIELFPRLFPAQAGRLQAAGVALRFLRWAP